MNADKKKVKDFLYEQETYLIRKACFNVWNKMGSAFKESAIDKALTLELQKQGFKVEDQKKNQHHIRRGESWGVYS